MSAPPHLDAGRIYRLAPFEEVVTELRKALAASVVPGVAGGNGQGLYVLLGDEGAAVATLDGAALADRRTPAESALATDALARDDVPRLAVFGTDVQAREHVRRDRGGDLIDTSATQGKIGAAGYSRETDPHDHAEEVALTKIAPDDPRLPHYTIYTGLEPCSKRASRPRTCTDLILAAGIPA